MAILEQVATGPAARSDGGALAARLAAVAAAIGPEELPPAVAEKAALCLLDFLGCAAESADGPLAPVVEGYGAGVPPGPSTVLFSPRTAGAGEAALLNGILAHGLIREDMHAASSSHLGVAVLPAALAVAERDGASGPALLAAIVAGYEIAGRIGRAVVDADIARRFRPTGIVGPIGAAVAATRLSGGDEAALARAIALAANMTGGFNAWPHAGGWEVFAHAGLAARSGVTAAALAIAGLPASATALEGTGGLFEALGRPGAPVDDRPAGEGGFEIAEVYFKPAPACNFVQTPCEAALSLVGRFDPAAVTDVEVLMFDAALAYPGCDNAAAFPGPIEAKMSIQYSVAAVLARGRCEEENYRVLDDPAVLSLARRVRLGTDAAFEAAFPPAQGAQVRLTLADGRTLAARLADCRGLDGAAVRARFRAAAADRLGEARADEAERLALALGTGGDVRPLLARLGAGQP